MASVLWVDDNIDQIGEYVKALENEGHVVATCSEASSALDLLPLVEFDFFLIDYRMPNMNGVQLLKRVIQAGVRGEIAILSSYLYLDDFRDELLRIDAGKRGVADYRIELIDKDFPNVDSPDFRPRFLAPIQSFFQRGATKSLARQLDKNVNVAGDPFAVSYLDFINLSLIEKDKITKKALSAAKSTIQKAFDDGAIWVFMCGNHETITSSANTMSDVLPNSTILDYAREQDCAPYQFFNSVDVDEIGLSSEAVWQSCGKTDQLDSYPSAQLEMNGKKFLVHFDTGAPWTFFSYEELLEANIVGPNELLFTPARRGESKYLAAFLDVEVVIRCQSSDQTQSVRLKGQVVRDWLNGPFVRKCRQQKCQQIGEVISDGKNCLLRIGLIGRNILTDNKLALVLDGATQTTQFHSKQVTENA